MAKISRTFVSSDSWILLALHWASLEAPAGLADILYSADAINKALPTAAELDGALNRLLAAGFITQDKSGFTLAELAHAAIAKLSRPRDGVLDLWEKLDRLLACPCCGPNLKSVRRRTTVSTADLRQALKAYNERAEHEVGRWRR